MNFVKTLKGVVPRPFWPYLGAARRWVRAIPPARCYKSSGGFPIHHSLRLNVNCSRKLAGRQVLASRALRQEQLVNQLQAVLLFPLLKEPNPWAEVYLQEARENLQAVAKVLGVEQG